MRLTDQPKIGDMLKFNRWHKEPFYCIVLESNKEGGVVWWYVSGNTTPFSQPVDWTSVYGEFERLG